MDFLIEQIPIVSIAFIILAIWLSVRYLIPRPEEVQRFYEESMDQHQKNKWRKIAERGPTVKVLQSAMLIFGVFFNRFTMADYRIRTNKLLKAAGYPMALNCETYCALMVVTTIVGVTLGVFMGIGMNGEVNIPILLLMTLIGLYLPNQWLKEKVQKRRWEVSKDLPYKVDLLTLSVEAGMDFQAALENVVERDNSESPLREELFMMLQEVRVGKTRSDALRGMAARLNISALSTLVGNIIQGEAMGTPIGHILKTQSEMMRVQRSHRAEKLAGEAPIKIIFPLLFIFIAVFLVLFGSIIVRYMRGELGL